MTSGHAYYSLRWLSAALKAFAIIEAVCVVAVGVVMVLVGRAIFDSFTARGMPVTLEMIAAALGVILVVMMIGFFMCLITFAAGAFIMLMVDIEESVHNVEMWFRQRDALEGTQRLEAYRHSQVASPAPAARPAASVPVAPRQPRKQAAPGEPLQARPVPEPFYVREVDEP